MATFVEGQAVHTRFGKGVVRALRNGNRLVVEVQGRALVLRDSDVTARPEDGPRRSARAHGHPSPHVFAEPLPRPAAREVDLHGLTIPEALARVEQALNDALLADHAELRLIHGRSGGRIRAAVHRRLAQIRSVKGFELAPGNDGVTIVHL